MANSLESSELTSREPSLAGKRPRLRLNIAWSIAGNVGYLATQWAILSLIAKLQGPEMVGLYSLGLAVTAPLMMFASMRLRILQGTDANDQFTFSDYLGLRLVSILIAMLVLLGVCAIGPFSEEAKTVIGLVGLIKAIDLVNDTTYGLWQKHERMKLIFMARVGNGLLTLLGFAIVLSMVGSLTTGLAFSAIISLLMLFTFNIYWVWRVNATPSVLELPPTSARRIKSMLAEVKPRWEPSSLAPLIRMGIPLAISTSLFSLDSSIPRLVVQRELGTEALGVFSALAYTMLVGSTLANALTNAASPRLAQYAYHKRIGAFWSLLVRLMGVGLLGTVLMMTAILVVGERLIAVAYTPEFAREMPLLMLLTAATGLQFIGTVLGLGLTVTRKLSATVWVQSVGLFIGIALYFPLAQRYGLNGVGIAAVAVALCRTIAFLVIMVKQMPRD